ncbi:astacin [Ancylostoma duodenale]|uniref:Zinc metalloproteinase n=1 Tax=Ancylostoma duodenale TaxID=51022 RepID=A0A0C2DAD9_9BILA|nr:astacin [Ancylostoma duodenale]
MRVLILVLLLAACASAGFFDTKLGEKIKNTWSKIKTAMLDSKTLVAIRDKIHSLRDKIKAKLALSPERKARLANLMKHIINFKRNHVHKQGDSIEEINKKSKIRKLLYQGDIVLTRYQAADIEADVLDDPSRMKRQAFRDARYPKTLWENNVAHYFFHDNATELVKRVFRKAANLWMKDTCIDIVEKEQQPDCRLPTRVCLADGDAIRVFVEDGCWSYVGRLGTGAQDLSLGDGCESVGTAAHELGHALGFFHTHSRHDRDKFITYNPDNVQKDWDDQFTKQTPFTNENYGIKYDYGSIMHYGATSGLWVFHTSEICKRETSIKCKMGGLPHPRNCSTCICPSGYGGDDCTKRPPGCGEELEATDTPKTLTDLVGDRSRGFEERDDFDKCIYWIKAPTGKKVEIKLMSFSDGLAQDGCPYAGVEIKTHKDQKITGYRFCAKEDAGVTLVSTGNTVPIITYNRVFATETIGSAEEKSISLRNCPHGTCKQSG